MKPFLTFLLILQLSLVACAKKKNTASPGKASADMVASFEGVVWGFDFISENEAVVTLREGKAYYYNFSTKEKKKLKSPNAKSQGQGGLLDVLFLENNNKKYIYFTFSEEYEGGLTTSLAVGEYKNKSISGLKTIFRAKVEGGSAKHYGSRLLYKDNHLYMTIGDRGKRVFAQKLSHHNGKILKLTLEGKPASDNPFLKTKNALPEIWSYGHRNPQGIDSDPVTQKIYSVEFGPRGGDELNLIKKKSNYGWPVITHGKEYWGPSIGPSHKKGMEQPIEQWTPVVSPSGMEFYTGDKLPRWENNLFLANLSSQHLRRLVLKDNKVIKQEKLFAELKERVRHVRTGKDGYLYFSTDSGNFYKVSE